MKNRPAAKEGEGTGSFRGRLWLAITCILKRKKKKKSCLQSLQSLLSWGVSCHIRTGAAPSKFVSLYPCPERTPSPQGGQLWWLPSGHSLAHSCATMMSPGTALQIHQHTCAIDGDGYCLPQQGGGGRSNIPAVSPAHQSYTHQQWLHACRCPQELPS